jgi:hypothetical protein
MTEPYYTKETVKPEVARINFFQPRRDDQHIYEEELKQKANAKRRELEHELLRKNLVAVSDFTLETTIIPEMVCEKKGCQNIIKYSDYKLAIEQCRKEHSNKVHLRLTTLGMVWCLTVDKKYEFLKGKLLNSRNEFTYYNVTYPEPCFSGKELKHDV